MEIATHTHVDIYPVDDYPNIRMMTDDGDKIVKVRANIKEDERWTLCIINCVEVVKSLLGIRSFKTVTPRQLYKYLGGKNE